jgi:hypothetical protein
VECPKCKYVRTATDGGPNYECPKCGIIYSKFDPAVEERDAALRTKIATRTRRPSAPVEQEIQTNSIESSQISIFAKFREFISTPKSQLAKFGLWSGLIVLICVLLRFAGEIGLWLLFVTPIILLLLKKTHVAKVTTCRACKGLVAYGAISCPHCGKSKPAPKPTRKATVIIAWVFMGMMVFIGSRSPGILSSVSNPSLANDQAVRLGAQATIQAAGYRCGTVTHMTKLLIGTGFSVHCDNYRDNYSVIDEGGWIHVRLD